MLSPVVTHFGNHGYIMSLVASPSGCMFSGSRSSRKQQQNNRKGQEQQHGCRRNIKRVEQQEHQEQQDSRSRGEQQDLQEQPNTCMQNDRLVMLSYTTSVACSMTC